MRAGRGELPDRTGDGDGLMRWGKRAGLLAAAAAFFLTACTTPPSAAPPVLQSASKVEQMEADPFIEDLLAQMTLEEKVGQLSLYPTGFEILDPNPINPVFRMTPPEQRFDDIRAGRVTGIFNGFGTDYMMQVQKMAVEESRLGIPLIIGADVIHGFRTVFPVPLAETASWEPELAERTARVAAEEATASGINWNFAPMVDLSRDARWGRIVEGAGEDVHLNKVFAAARTRGYQGEDLSAHDTMIATPKHFAGYGAAEGGLDYNSAEISERTLREHHLPPFKAAFDAGAFATMSAFHDNAGVPATADAYLLTDVLRGEWGFDGFVVSDFNSDFELIAHGVAADERDATRLAFLAGTDMSMNSGIYMEHLPDLVRSGEVPMARLDDAVRRVLTAKKKLGLFEDPYRYIDAEREAAEVRAPDHLELAREAARKSIVMLQNENAVLPLSKTGLDIALIGPFVDMPGNLNGPWTIFGKNDESVPVQDGLLATLGGGSSLTKLRGADFAAPLENGLVEAQAAAAEADVVVLMLGETEAESGEAKSKTEITLPEAQIELARAVAESGKPTIVLLVTGRPLELPDAVLAADAILVTWFLGSEGGHAVADILFGDESPSGRLPVSFPIRSGQEPYFYNHKNTGRADEPSRADRFKTKYLDADHRPRFAFGHGLTYGDIVYDRIALSSETLAWDGSITVTGRVTNRGARQAAEVVQLYVRDRVASITRPVRELKGFQKIELSPGETVDVSFELSRDDLLFVGRDHGWTVEPGEFDVWVAPAAVSGLMSTFRLEPPEAAEAG